MEPTFVGFCPRRKDDGTVSQPACAVSKGHPGKGKRSRLFS